MARPGPPKKPVALRVLSGERRPSRVNYREPKMLDHVPAPPDALSEKARAVWDAVVAQLRPTRMLTDVDAYMLAVFCEHIVNHQEQTALVRNSSHLLLSKRTGDMVKNPLVGMMRNEAHVVRLLASEFGLTPAARASLVAPPAPQSDLEQLLS
jgi:P27 family predicted phage terminase small subunit